jgi:hypothetical protein
LILEFALHIDPGSWMLYQTSRKNSIIRMEGMGFVHMSGSHGFIQ